LSLALESAACLFTDLPCTAAEADLHRPTTVPLPASAPLIPPEYGAIIYQKKGASQKHIYIVGDSHRSSLTGRNGRNTVRTQIEVYRIGEWLIRNEGVQLVLPEGFFKKRPADFPTARAPAMGSTLAKIPIDDRLLEERLADDSVFTSAEMLLKVHHNVLIQQVEDERLYVAIGEFLRLTESVSNSAYVPIFFHMELEQMQERRTAAMLQNIPKAIDYEFQGGRISNRKALFTIGMGHIDEIIRYLKEDRISISPSTISATANPHHTADQKLLSQDYGVTVILPKALAEDREARRLTKLDNI
jgi:hypothetical protein